MRGHPPRLPVCSHPVLPYDPLAARNYASRRNILRRQLSLARNNAPLFFHLAATVRVRILSDTFSFPFSKFIKMQRATACNPLLIPFYTREEREKQEMHV